MVCVHYGVATSTSTSSIHSYTFQWSLRDTVLLRRTGLVAAKDYLGTSCGQLKEGGADLWSCLVGGTALGPRPCASQEGLACCGEQWPSHRSTKHDQAPLLCGVAHGCLARGVQLGMCGLGAWRLERRTRYSRSTVTVVGRPARRATRCVESACVMRCAGRAVHSAPKLGDNQIAPGIFARVFVVSWSEGLYLRTHIISHSRPVCGVRNALRGSMTKEL